MEFVKVAETADLTPGTKTRVTVAGRDILLANVDGIWHAIDNRCTHMGGALDKGELEGVIVTCPRHHSTFDVTTGKLVKAGTILGVSVKAQDTRSYPVRIAGTDVLIGFE